MTPELRLKISDTTIGNYIRIATERGLDLPSTDVLSESVQQALMELCEDEIKKVEEGQPDTAKFCPLKNNQWGRYNLCIFEKCAWYNLAKKRCGVVSKSIVCKD